MTKVQPLEIVPFTAQKRKKNKEVSKDYHWKLEEKKIQVTNNHEKRFNHGIIKETQSKAIISH